MTNILVERFLAVEEWNALYEQRLSDLQAELLDSGVADSVLERWAAIITSSGLVDADTIATESDQISAQSADSSERLTVDPSDILTPPTSMKRDVNIDHPRTTTTTTTSSTGDSPTTCRR